MHLHVHRQDLRNAVKGMHPPIRLLALNWSLDQPHAEIHRICADHIMTRGTNHQTLHSDKQGKAHESVLWRFLIDTEPLADDEADSPCCGAVSLSSPCCGAVSLSSPCRGAVSLSSSRRGTVLLSLS
ncbi:hypothetical protein EDB84DRAFT_1564935 [Lactarius hengduanensis]|nr:hypothetical protein EDB84DRAFT_1564935 [Lactarius hengduanensis]